MTLLPHRKKNPRKCDRCNSPATWIWHRPGRRDEYVCERHRPALDQ